MTDGTWWIAGLAAALLVAVADGLIGLAYRRAGQHSRAALSYWRAPSVIAVASVLLAGMQPVLTLIVGGLLSTPWIIALEFRRSRGATRPLTSLQPDWILATWIWACAAVGVALAVWDRSATVRDVAAVVVIGVCSGLVCAYANATTWACTRSSSTLRQQLGLGVAYMALVPLLPIVALAPAPAVVGAGVVSGAIFMLLSEWVRRQSSLEIESPRR